MARRATRASDPIAILAKAAESESVKLRALRSISSDVVAVSKLPDLGYRMAEIAAQYTSVRMLEEARRRPR